MGMFAAPNTTAIMNAVPAEHRGASSGMRVTLQNTGTALSMTLYFSILIFGLTQHLPAAMYQGLMNAGVPSAVALQVANLKLNTATGERFFPSELSMENKHGHRRVF
ncbi:MAG: hypothetical protein AWM53_00987 [Candidatus Dichloromethanomonas elyunquensis]|nr:MAG: hypothetical protein AWM53_00987 [Candidatus Dichloromethanomonas elyunquensis]